MVIRTENGYHELHSTEATDWDLPSLQEWLITQVFVVPPQEQTGITWEETLTKARAMWSDGTDSTYRSKEHEKIPITSSTPGWVSLSAELPRVKGGAVCGSLNSVAFCVVLLERVPSYQLMTEQKKTQLYPIPRILPVFCLVQGMESTPGAGGRSLETLHFQANSSLEIVRK